MYKWLKTLIWFRLPFLPLIPLFLPMIYNERLLEILSILLYCSDNSVSENQPFLMRFLYRRTPVLLLGSKSYSHLKNEKFYHYFFIDRERREKKGKLYAFVFFIREKEELEAKLLFNWFYGL